MHPPLHFFLLHFWIDIFGASADSARYFSFAASIFAAFGLFLLTKKIYSAKAGLYAVLLFFLSTYIHFYSIYARMYIFVAMFAVFSLYFFLFLLYDRLTLRQKIIYSLLFQVSTVMLLYSNIIGSLVLLVEWLVLGFSLYYYHKSKTNPWLTFSNLILAGLLFAPWFLFFLSSRLSFVPGDAWYYQVHAPWYFPFDFIANMFVSSDNLLLKSLVFFLFFAIILNNFFSFKRSSIPLFRFKSGWSKNIPALLLLIMPFFVLPFFSLLKIRFFIVSAIGLFMLLGASLANLKNKALLILIFLIISLIPSYKLLLTMPGEGWDKIARFIVENEKNGDIIITATAQHFLPLGFYYKGDLKKEMIIDQEEKEDDELLTVLKTCVAPTLSPDNISQLKNLTQGHNRIFLVVTNTNFGQAQKIAVEWFEKNGWQIDNSFYHDGFDRPAVIIYKKTPE